MAEAHFDITDEDAEPDDVAHDTTMQSPDYTPLPENASPHSRDDRGLSASPLSHDEIDPSPLDDLEARFDALAPRADGNSPQPMDELDAQPAETQDADVTSTADETTGGTTGRTASTTSDPWTHDGPAGSDDW